MADIAVITGASSGLGVKFLEAVINRYPQMHAQHENNNATVADEVMNSISK